MSARRGCTPLGQIPPPRPDDKGDCPVSEAQQGAYGSASHRTSNWPSRTTATSVIPQCPLAATFHPLLKVPVLPSFRSVGWWPHLPWLPLHRPHGGPPLRPKLSLGFHRSGPWRYVDGTPPGISIPGRASTVQRSASTADWFDSFPFDSFGKVCEKSEIWTKKLAVFTFFFFFTS